MKNTLKAIKLALLALGMAAFAATAQAAYTDDCITFSSAESFTLKTHDTSKHWDGTLWTSTDKTTWTEWNGAEVSAAKTGGTYKLYVRGNTVNTKITGNSGYSPPPFRWVLAGNDIACTGNIETLRGATGNNPSPTKMANFCYYFMFFDCTALTSAPALPATTLVEDCYKSMFGGCTSLTNAPALPATALADGCYYDMFGGCTSLTNAPTLPATALADYCYYQMFSGCTALEVNTEAPGKEWKIPATSTTATDWGKDMFFGTKGTLQGQPELNTTYYIRSALPPTPTDDCITFSSAEPFTLKTYDSSKHWDGTLWTSTDKTNWTVWKGAEVSASQTGGTYKLYVRGNTVNTKITGNSGYSPPPFRWVLAGNDITCSGNIETLRGATGDDPATTQMADYCYCGMFESCTALTEAPALPKTALANYCYQSMFGGCTALTSAPALPATTLASGCYSGMFYGCTSLTEAPALPAMTQAMACYYGMFVGCTALTSAPALPATTLASGCYSGMFYGCSSLTVAPALPATTLADYCYGDMFWDCTSLTNAPELPATELAEGCYNNMFFGCTALTDAPALPATTLANYCYQSMFYCCKSLTNAPTLPATELAEGCYNNMFFDCEALKDAPALPATTLASDCYSWMFNGCSALTDAPALPATELANYCYGLMFSGCTALTSAPALPATTLANYCCYRMFDGCAALEVNEKGPGKEWKIPATSTTASDWGTDMFKDTKGTLKGQPALNQTYYIKSALVPGSEDFPWQIGAGEGDTVEAWTNGTTLVIQGAGKMMDFDAEDSVVPWPVEQIAAVNISSNVTAIGQNAWLGLADSVSYNNLSATAAKTMGNGFGGTTQYARTAFREFLVNGASINATVALETAKSLTNEWTEVELTDEDVHVENGRIIIQHESAPQSQGFYLLQPTE